MFGKERFREFAEARFAEAQNAQGHEEAGRCGHHRHREERHHGRHGGPEMFGGFFGGRGGHGFGRGFGGGGDRERLFDNGELRLVILQLVAEKPSYGYEIIKAIEERLSGGYAPSPGVVYPTLTLLEEEGYATSSAEGSKKLYTVTGLGTEFLKTNQGVLKAIFGRMEQAGKAFGRGRSPQIMRAMMNLGFALRMRTGQGNLSPEQVSKIAQAIDAAARAVDEV